MIEVNIPTPTEIEVKTYLNKWKGLENYVLQEESLNKLFKMIPDNQNIEDILIKSSTLNDFYSTNIFLIFAVAKHIKGINNIDERLKRGDKTLVEEIANVEISGKQKCFFSFASKYCSNHNPEQFPIYDSYVAKVLLYFSRKDKFRIFKSKDLKKYDNFISLLNKFSEHYKLQNYSLKELDRYLWQLGKEYYKKNKKPKIGIS